MSYFARNLWHRMWENIHADDEDGVLDALDLDGDGSSASRRSTRRLRASWAVDGLYADGPRAIRHRFADVNGQGEVTRDDLLRFVRDGWQRLRRWTARASPRNLSRMLW